MTEPTSEPSASSAAQAGALLRQAREAQGVALDTLASLIKVTPAKLAALEAGRLDELPDANFARALAMTVCRVLKIDQAPVLAALPSVKAIPLGRDRPALNQPFKESKAGNLSFDSSPAWDPKTLLRPQWLAPILLLLASVVVYFLPESVSLPRWAGSSAPAVEAPSQAVSASAAMTAAAVGVVAPVAGQASTTAQPPLEEASAVVAASSPGPLAGQSLELSPVTASAAASSGGESPSPAPLPSVAGSAASAPENVAALVLVSREAAWVEVKDANGRKLLSRELSPGETVGIDGKAPLKLRLGNAPALEVSYQGKGVDLTPYVRNKVARLELP